MGRATAGVRGMKLKNAEDAVVAADVARDGAVMLFVSSSGHGKRTKLDAFNRQGRGGQGVRGMKITASRGEVVAAFTVTPDDEILVFSSGGNIIRMGVMEISAQGRDATGVRVARLGAGRDGERRGAGAGGRVRGRRSRPSRLVARNPRPPSSVGSGERRGEARDGYGCGRSGRTEGRQRPASGREAPAPAPAPPHRAAADRPAAGAAARAAATPTEAAEVAPAPAPSARRYRQTIHRVDLWTVLKMSVCFYICGMAVTMVAIIALWVIGDAAGVINSVEDFLGDLLQTEDFTFLDAEILRGTVLVVRGARGARRS